MSLRVIQRLVLLAAACGALLCASAAPVTAAGDRHAKQAERRAKVKLRSCLKRAKSSAKRRRICRNRYAAALDPKRGTSAPQTPVAPESPTPDTRPPTPNTPTPPPSPPPATAPPSAPSPAIPAPVTPTQPPIATTPRLFAETSVWNAALPADAPLDPRSPDIVGALTREVAKEVGGNYGPWINFDQYSTPVYRAEAGAPTVKVTIDVYAPALQADMNAVPIPANAVPARGSDAHLTVYQPSTDTLWELWLARKAADGWHARWGGRMTGVSRNPGYFPNPYGATATSLPLLGGLMTIDELKAGRIDHALALALPNTAQGSFVWPAQRGDGRTTGPEGIPQGTHFRIDPSVDLTKLGLSPLALTLARAAQRYGIIVRDTAGCTVFYAEDPVRTPGDPYGQIFGGEYPNRLLANFPWSRLQVVAPRGG